MSQDGHLQRTVEVHKVDPRERISERSKAIDQESVEVSKLQLRSGFLHGASLSECLNFHAGTVSRWSRTSLRSGVLRGCVKAQTSSGSLQWSSTSILMLVWCMVRLHEPSSVRGFVDGARRFGHSWEEVPSFCCEHQHWWHC